VNAASKPDCRQRQAFVMKVIGKNAGEITNCNNSRVMRQLSSSHTMEHDYDNGDLRERIYDAIALAGRIRYASPTNNRDRKAEQRSRSSSCSLLMRRRAWRSTPNISVGMSQFRCSSADTSRNAFVNVLLTKRSRNLS
jgi:hypothetical protein